jgi:metal-dependent amidase/aminoacylase/carboxypeptidase family protein
MDELAPYAVGIAGLLAGVGALLRGRAKRDEASAAAVSELIVQIGAVRRDLQRETLARVALQGQVDTLETQLGEAVSRSAHLEGQVHVLTLEARSEREARIRSEAREAALATELHELRAAITGGHTTVTLPPPRG